MPWGRGKTKVAKQLGLEYVDDINSIDSESTASFSDEFGDQELDNLPELTQMRDPDTIETSSSLSSNIGPPGTVKARPPKEQKDAMKDQEVLLKLQELCINSDPRLIYSNMNKIGQG
jgi:hypothetical protein